jgi:hypothetical protein
MMLEAAGGPVILGRLTRRQDCRRKSSANKKRTRKEEESTTGAVFGALAEASCGEDGIPQFWRGKLATKELIESFAGELFALSARAAGS